MRSFENLSLLLLSFAIVGEYVHAQTTSAIYVPSVSDSGGLDDGDFLLASVIGTQNGVTVYQIVLGSTGDDGPAPTLTLSEGPSTAHLVGSFVDSGVTASVDIQCNINGDTSSCTETDIEALGTISSSSSVSAFTESVSLVPVTLVTVFPGASVTTSAGQPTSSPTGSSDSTGNSTPSSSGGSSGNPSVPAPSSGSSPAPVPSPTGSTNSSPSPTTLNPPPNSANPRITSARLLILPLVVLPMLF